MSGEQGYNGWKNYTTWCVNLWLANEEGLYGGAIARAEAVMGEEHPTSPYWTVEESHRYGVADSLKTWVTLDLAPDLGASFAADLLSYALDQVDWNEIADSWIESVRDQVEA